MNHLHSPAKKISTAVLLLSILTILSACGGGGGGEGGNGGASSNDEALVSACSGVNCAATTPNQYSGVGTGVWMFNNTSDADVTVVADIAGVTTGKKVTLSFSNGSSTNALTTPQSGTQASSEAVSNRRPLSQSSQVKTFFQLNQDTHDHAHRSIREKTQSLKNRLHRHQTESQIFPELEPASAEIVAPQFTPALNAAKNWLDFFDGTNPVSYATTNKFICTLPSGRKIVFWQHDADSIVTPAIMTRFTNAACGTSGGFARINGLIGDAWGSHAYNNLIVDTALNKQDINIVFIKATSTAGWAGYFYGGNNFKTTAAEPSNEALVFFINTNGLSSDVDFYISTLFHEAAHMVAFFQNAVKQGKESQSWLDETFAMMTEDIVTTAVTGYNKIATYRIPSYLQSGANVSLNNWVQLSSAHYHMGGAFGAFINRQYGLNVYKQLVSACATGSAKTNSYDCLDTLIKANGGVGIKDALSKFGATVHARLPSSNNPAGYGYIARTDSGYTLQAIDLSPMALSAPMSLSNYGSMSHTYSNEIIPSGITRFKRSGILVPAGTHLQVLIR